MPSRIPKAVFIPKHSKSKKSRNRRNRRKHLTESRKKKKRKQVLKDEMFILTDDDTLQVCQVEGMNLDDTNNEDDEEIDAEYLRFMETNLRHRLKYSQLKELKAKNEASQSLELTLQVTTMEITI